MTIMIFENRTVSRIENVPYVFDKDDMRIGMREVNYNVIDTDDPKNCKGKECGTLKIEFTRYGLNQKFTKPYTWSWNICYHTDTNTYYFAYMVEEWDKYHGSRYREFDVCFVDAYDSLMENLDEVKSMITKIIKHKTETKEAKQ